MGTRYETTCDACYLIVKGFQEDVKEHQWNATIHNYWIDSDAKQNLIDFDLCDDCAKAVGQALTRAVKEIQDMSATSQAAPSAPQT